MKKICHYCLALGMLLQACTKNQNNVDVQNINTIDGEKQTTTVNFSNTIYQQQQGISIDNGALHALSTNAFVESKTITLQAFKKNAPFIAVYGFIEGQNMFDNNVTIAFAGSANGKQWQSWITLTPNMDAGSDASRVSFNNIELDKSTQYVKYKIQFANTQATLKTAKLFFFNPEVTSQEQQATIDAEAKKIHNEVEGISTNRASTARCSKPSFTTRATWGARAATSTPVSTTVNFLVVHHETGSNSSVDWAARVRSVQNFHMDSNGWADIGYNYLVDPNGVAYEGRGGGENIVGAHVCGKNGNTMGICLLGNFTSVKPTNDAEYTLKRILAWKCKQRGLDATGTGYHVDRTIHRISGHKANCATECPGTMLFNDLGRLRSDVKTNFINQCN